MKATSELDEILSSQGLQYNHHSGIHKYFWLSDILFFYRYTYS